MHIVRAWFGAPWMKEAEHEGLESAGTVRPPFSQREGFFTL